MPTTVRTGHGVRIQPLDAPLLRALRLGDRQSLEQATGATFPEPLVAPPLFDEDLLTFEERVEEDPASTPWWAWLIVDEPSGAAVGVVGLGGRPDAGGTVTVGYAVYPAHEGRGHATAATKLLVAWALEDPRVTTVEATIPLAHHASIRVAAKAGFAVTDEIRHEAVGAVRVYRLVRKASPAATGSGRTFGALLLAAGMMLFPTPADAQGRRPGGSVDLAIRGGYDFQVDDLLLGGQLRFALPRGANIVAGGDWIFTTGSYFQGNLDLLLPLGPNGGLYAGGGIGTAFINQQLPGSETEVTVGTNLLLGLAPYRWGRDGPRWFIEGRWFLRSGDDPFRLVLGLATPIGS